MPHVDISFYWRSIYLLEFPEMAFLFVSLYRCATFVMDTPSSNISVSTPDQSGTWTEDAEPRPPPAVVRSLLVDAQTQTEEQDEVQEGTNTALTATGETVEPMDTVEVCL